MDLEGKCVVVTGGAHGIGRALAEAFAAAGARVVVADVNAARTGRIAARIDGRAVVCDVGQPDDVARLVAEATDAFGPIEVFCSNAGIGDRGDGLASTREQIDEITRINLLSHVWAAQMVVPDMVTRGRGYLVQTISSASLITGPSGLGYTFTKHGALGFAEWMALNYAHLGITVTCLCPNAVNTGMMGRNEDEEAPGGPATPVREGLGEIVEPELCAAMTLEAMSEGRFLVLPHPRVGESFLRKAGDYDRWLEGTNRRLRRMQGEEV
jgi:NAD(P)-dependent dehydrogenase (short-subunit alcohol dehydrogenase family)